MTGREERHAQGRTRDHRHGTKLAVQGDRAAEAQRQSY